MAQAFYSPRVQKKMFYSGQGEMSGCYVQGFSKQVDVPTYGRTMFADLEATCSGLLVLFENRLCIGYTGRLAYPHNDWLLTLYDYGIVGVCLFL